MDVNTSCPANYIAERTIKHKRWSSTLNDAEHPLFCVGFFMEHFKLNTNEVKV